jgi:hypothetical protein
MVMVEEENVHYYILDPSALVYGGIGKIKKWVEFTLANNANRKDFSIVFYVPLYTLKELDFLKKVFNPLISANARESIKFIDNQISNLQFDDDITLSSSDNDSDFGGGNVSDIDDSTNSDSDNFSLNSKTFGLEPTSILINSENINNFDDYTDFESYNKMKSLKSNKLKIEKKSIKPKVTFILEAENSVGPDWKIASGYRRSTPLLSQLPKPINGSSSEGQFNHDQKKKAIGVFGNNIPGTFNMINNHNNLINMDFNDKNTSNDINVNRNENMDERAIVPIKLKYLIRSCIQKQYIENKNIKESAKINWHIISEDATTSIWLKSFGLSVKTLNEVQHDFDDYSGISKSNVLFDPDSGKLVETTLDDLQRKNKIKKPKSWKTNNQKNFNKNEDSSNENEIKYNKNKNRNKNRNRNRKKNNDQTKDNNKNINSETNSKDVFENGKAHVVSADAYTKRGNGELWTP